MNANFLRTKNYKAQLNLQQNQQVDDETIPNMETTATTSYSNDVQTSKWNKFEQSEDAESEPHESNSNKRFNEQNNVSHTTGELNRNPNESGITFKKSKWSDFIDDEEDELDLSQVNELDNIS